MKKQSKWNKSFLGDRNVVRALHRNPCSKTHWFVKRFRGECGAPGENIPRLEVECGCSGDCCTQNRSQFSGRSGRWVLAIGQLEVSLCRVTPCARKKKCVDLTRFAPFTQVARCKTSPVGSTSASSFPVGPATTSMEFSSAGSPRFSSAARSQWFEVASRREVCCRLG